MHAAAIETLHLAEADPGRSVAQATGIARQARRAGEYAAASVAERALGIAALHLRDTDQSVRHLRSAAVLGRQADDPALVAEARMRLAAVLNVRGRPRAALGEIDAVLAESTGADQARAWAQKGAILLQLGRLDAAVENFELALPGLRATEDLMWLKRVLANRGLVHARRFRFGDAESDLVEALRLNQQLGLDLSVAFIEQNLGWVNTLAGNVPRALDHLDRAEETLRRLGAQLGFLLEDRATLLLSVGLVGEAHATAREAVAALERERQRIALPDVRLLLARLSLLDGDADSATDQARRAVAEFARLGRPESVVLARFLLTASRAAGSGRSRIALGALRRTVDALDVAGWRADAIDARLLLAALAFERRSGDRGHSQLALASESRSRGPAMIRAAAWEAEARLRWQSGRRRHALDAAAAGLRVLDEQRAGLGATDLRAHTGRSRGRLADLGLRIAVESGRPETILAWAEHGRASHLLLPPVLPPDDNQLASDLAELRSAAGEVDAARTGGRDLAAAIRHQVAVERRIRDGARRRPGVAGTSTRVVALAELTSTLGDAALVEFVELGGALYALTVADGRASWAPLGVLDDVRGLVDRLPFALHRLATRRGDVGALRALARDASDRLDALLLAPLSKVIGDRPLVVVPIGRLQSLPWSVLPSCVGRAVTVAPSATTWHSGSQTVPPTRRAVVVAGPGLPGAVREASRIAELHGTSALAGESAKVETALRALRGADVAHLATHGRVHPEQPLFSSLVLADGPLTGYDLERLRPVPRLVVLAGCDTGRHVVRPGDELLGLTATLLARGAQQVVASVVPIPDAETESLMTAFHTELVAGLSAASALAVAQTRVIGDGAAAAAAGFVCIGGTFRLRSRGRAGRDQAPLTVEPRVLER